MLGRLNRICQLPVPFLWRDSIVYRHCNLLKRPMKAFSGQKPTDPDLQDSTQQPMKEQPTQPPADELSEKEVELVKKADEGDQLDKRARALKMLMGKQDGSLMKDLVVARKVYRQTQNTSQLRDAILFDEILNNQINILIYDTEGRFFKSSLTRLLLYLAAIGLSWASYYMMIRDPKTEIIMNRTSQGELSRAIHILCSVGLFIYGSVVYRKRVKLHVEKIVYSTADESFDLVRRRLWGKRYIEKVHRYDLVYTENKHLWKRGINYFHVQSKRLYQIGSAQAWKRQDLFSHLISQRIRRSMSGSSTPTPGTG